MTLAQWGVVAEIIAAAAVLISLWFLVIEVRRNLAQSKKQAWDDISLRRIEMLQPLYEDPELASLIWRGFAAKPRLEPGEWARFSLYIYTVFVVFELSFKKHREGDVSADGFSDSLRAYQWWLGMPGVRAWWKADPVGLSESFSAFVDQQMANVEPTAEMAQIAASSFWEAIREFRAPDRSPDIAP